MDYQIERLKAEDYDELLNVLNRVFDKKEGATFDIELPVMWERDDEHMSKHAAIRIDGKIAAVVGIYPLPAVVSGRPVMFGTVGNVATLPEYSGLGLMKRLMTYAMEQAKQMGFDVIRLGGKRQRYNRYGFENGGVDYLFQLTHKNLEDYYGGKAYPGSLLSGGGQFAPYLRFQKVGLQDSELMEFVKKLQETGELYTDRGNTEQLFRTLSAYSCGIWVAFGKDDKPKGYLCVSPDGTDIAEHRALSAKEEYQMICEWLLFSGVQELSFHTAPWECELNRLAGKICERWIQRDTNHFNPINWSKLLDALLSVKAKYWEIPEGGLVLRIEGYGTVEFAGGRCFASDKTPQLTVSHLDAVRFLLGNLPAAEVVSLADLKQLPRESRLYIQNVFPLPLWWCNQDRV